MAEIERILMAPVRDLLTEAHDGELIVLDASDTTCAI
jgi:hypothetical protein